MNLSRAHAITVGVAVGALIGAVVIALAGCTAEKPVVQTSSPMTADGAAEGTLLPVYASDEPLILTAKLTGNGGGIFVAAPDGSGFTQIGTDVLPGVHKHPAWSADGQSVLFVDETSEKVYIAHLDGSATESLAACDVPGCDYPAWSPDGTQIAFSRYENGTGIVGPAAVGIYVLTLSTGKVSPVVRLERPLLADVPRWSPDGTSLVFGVDQMDEGADETGAAIATVPVTGGEPHYLTDFSGFGYAPDWNWSTGEITFGPTARLYASSLDESTEAWSVFGIQPDGTELRTIAAARPGQQLRGARWTPDGTAITAYDTTVPGGVLIDPAAGSSEPFATDGTLLRPQVRPLA